MRKSDGTLFYHVCNDQKIQPSSLIHTGDNFYSDCAMAKRIGVKYVFTKNPFIKLKSYFREEKNFFLQLLLVQVSKQGLKVII
jgi:predicted HAD superfamily hydrolase